MFRQHAVSSLKARLPLAASPLTRRLAFLAYRLWTRKAAWHRKPEIDRALGIDTTGLIPDFLLAAGHAADQAANPYVGVNPNVLRAALGVIPELERFGFVDLGAGKGRAMAVASEFPFREIIGIELNPELCRIATRNAAIIARRHPRRPRITLLQGDASTPALPEGPVVLMLYHSFARPLVERLVTHLELSGREMYLVYVNPVNGDLFDAAAGFSRWYAAQIPLPREEDYFEDGSAAVIIWRKGGGQAPSLPGAEQKIVILKPGMQAKVEA